MIRVLLALNLMMGCNLDPLSISCQKERAKTDRREFLRTMLKDKGEVTDRDVHLTDFRLDKMTSDVGNMFLQSTLKMFSISDIYIYSCREPRHLQVIESGYAINNIAFDQYRFVYIQEYILFCFLVKTYYMRLMVIC